VYICTYLDGISIRRPTCFGSWGKKEQVLW
jgi:hypothetical protein